MAEGVGSSVSEKDRRVAAARRARIMRRTLWTLFFFALAGGLAYAAIYSGKSAPSSGEGPEESPAAQRPEEGPGELFAFQGQEHVRIGTPFAYNSNPPSSGPHYQSQANCGIYDYEVLDQIFIHNLEHGGIWIAYRSTIASQALADLKELVKELGGRKIVMAPRAVNDADVALVAWMRVAKFDLAGGEGLAPAQKELVRTFHRAWINHSPEQVPDFIPGVDPKSVKE